jgi:hypothetical protein
MSAADVMMAQSLVTYRAENARVRVFEVQSTIAIVKRSINGEMDSDETCEVQYTLGSLERQLNDIAEQLELLYCKPEMTENERKILDREAQS